MSAPTYPSVRDAAIAAQAMHGQRPYVVLACAGGTDEHWQLYLPPTLDMPAYYYMDGGPLEVAGH